MSWKEMKKNVGIKHCSLNKFIIKNDSYDRTPITLFTTKQQIQLPDFDQYDRFQKAMDIQDPLGIQNDFKQQHEPYRVTKPEMPAKVRGKKVKTPISSPIKNSFIIPSQIIKKPTIVLDLDHTLLSSSSQELFYEQVDTVPAKMFNDRLYTIYRSYLLTFLEFVKEHFEVIAWSAGEYTYVLDRLQYNNLDQYFDHILARQHCLLINNNYIKKLDLLGRDKRNIILLDDNFSSCIMNVSNCVPVNPFYGKKDNELLQLIVLLRKLLTYETLTKGVDAQLGKYLQKSSNIK